MASIKELTSIKCAARVAMFLSISAVSAAELPLAVRGQKAGYAIVLPSDASSSQRYAAAELRDFTEKVTGVRLPILTDAEPKPSKAILLGWTKWTAELVGARVPRARSRAGSATLTAASDQGLCDTGSDGFRLLSCPPHLLVVGSPERGTLYGVYELLERFAGCRWYASWCSKTPRLDRFAVPDNLDDIQTPAFAMREPYFYDVAAHGDFAARLRVNSRSWRNNEEKYGGNPFRFGGGLVNCHTFNVLLPQEVYFDSHPEYFSLVDGKRLRHAAHSQLCLTNPDVLKIVTSNVLERIRKDPGAKFYGVSQNDGLNYCRCPACKAVDDEEESHAGTMVRFVNAVAEAVAKEFPDVVIETLAYRYTRKPPKKTRLRHNVVPCLCTIECDFARPIDASTFKENVDFRRDIEEWGRQTDQLYVWDYVANFENYAMPWPNVYALQGNLKFFRANNVKELLSLGDYSGRHGDFAELKAWLLAKWMWNPDLPLKPLLDDFFAGYYGKAAPFVRRYFEVVHRLQQEYSAASGHPLKVFDGVTNPALPDSTLDEAEGLWRNALAAVKDDPAMSYNVRMSAFSFDYLRLERLRRKVDKVLFLAPESSTVADFAEAQSMAKSLLARMAEAKDIRLAEDGSRHNRLMEQWRELAARPPTTPMAVQCGAVEERFLDLGNKGVWGDFVDDAQAADGKAIRLCNTHSEWSVTFPMHRVAFEAGAKYSLRVRVRADKRRDGGEAFWAGIYDTGANVDRAMVATRTESASADYAWYEVSTWVPNDNELFWIGPGRFGKDGRSSINAMWIDKIEFQRAPMARK